MDCSDDCKPLSNRDRHDKIFNRRAAEYPMKIDMFLKDVPRRGNVIEVIEQEMGVDLHTDPKKTTVVQQVLDLLVIDVLMSASYLHDGCCNKTQADTCRANGSIPEAAGQYNQAFSFLARHSVFRQIKNGVPADNVFEIAAAEYGAAFQAINMPFTNWTNVNRPQFLSMMDEVSCFVRSNSRSSDGSEMYSGKAKLQLPFSTEKSGTDFVQMLVTYLSMSSLDHPLSRYFMDDIFAAKSLKTFKCFIWHLHDYVVAKAQSQPGNNQADISAFGAIYLAGGLKSYSKDEMKELVKELQPKVETCELMPEVVEKKPEYMRKKKQGCSCLCQ